MITFLQLRYFQALAEEQHLTRTAEKLYISQTTLSTMISRLERELGVRLFDRQGGGLRLNQCGKEYLPYVNAALLMLSDGEKAVRMLGRPESPDTLSLAVSGTNAWGEAIIDFQRTHPAYRITQQSEAMPALLDNLLSGRLDMALVGVGDLRDSHLEHLVLQEGRIYACLPHGHRLESRTALRLAELKEEPIISTLRGLPYTAFCMELFRQAGITPRIAAECDYPMRPRLLDSGLGIALLYGPSLKQAVVAEMFRPFTCIPIMDDCAVRRLALFWRGGRRLTPAMRDFIAFLKTRYPLPVQRGSGGTGQQNS